MQNKAHNPLSKYFYSLLIDINTHPISIGIHQLHDVDFLPCGESLDLH